MLLKTALIALYAAAVGTAAVLPRSSLPLGVAGFLTMLYRHRRIQA